MVLTLSLVGSFYAVFSIIVRAIAPTNECKSFSNPANVLENIYLVLIFIILIVSTTRQVHRSAIYYKWIGSILGGFMILTIVASLFYFFIKAE